MFSRSYEQREQDNIFIWERTEGNYFHKAMKLLRDYCGYDSYAISYYTLYSLNSQRDEIYKIVAMYEERGYLLNHKDSLVCNIAFLLFFISRKIPREKLNAEGGFVALMRVIENKTELNMNLFYKDNLSLQAFFKGDEIHPDFLQCKSWTQFILKNVNFFLPRIEYENNLSKHSIHVELTKKNEKTDYKAEELILSYIKKISADASEINLLLDCDNQQRWELRSTDFSDLFASAVAQLSSEHLENFFALTLKENAYLTAFNMFFISEKIKKPDGRRLFYSFPTYKHLIEDIFKLISQPVPSNLLLIVIEHGKNFRYNNSDVTYYYLTLYSKKKFIHEFNKVEAAFISCFKLNAYEVLLKAFDTNNQSVIEHLIQSNKIDLRNNQIISYDYSYEWDNEPFYGFRFNGEGSYYIYPVASCITLAILQFHLWFTLCA